MKADATMHALNSIAAQRQPVRATARFSSYFVVLGLSGLLSGCAGLVDKPVRPTLYDFGPGALSAPAAPARRAAPIMLADIEAAGALDGSAVLYRLGYADDHQLRPYAQARWSAPPPQLVRQRLREQFGRDRVVLNPGEGAALARTGGLLPRVVRIELEEFSHFFDSPAQSVGLLRLRATLLENTAGGERVLAQRNVVVQRPAPTADAAGGVRALTAAVDGAAEELIQWLAQVP
jgi:cholesterol transport system auxiliary component